MLVFLNEAGSAFVPSQILASNEAHETYESPNQMRLCIWSPRENIICSVLCVVSLKTFGQSGECK